MSEELRERARQAILRARRPAQPREASPAELRLVERTFRMMSQEHKDMVWMLQVENLTYPEIGKRLGIDVAEAERRTAETIGAWCRAMRRAERPWWRFW